MITVILIILTVLQIIGSVILGWSGVIVALGLPRKKPNRNLNGRKNRFAVIVCARNEEAVIARLLTSLKEQHYPKDAWHVYLLADHCTDRTAAIGRQYPFVTVYERNDGAASGKGAALSWGIEHLLRDFRDSFDAVLVFDADNLAEPDFMKNINGALNSGNDIVQGHRIAGEPFRSVITEWYAVYWMFYSHIYSYPREKLGLSCFLTGTGFSVRKELLLRYGWNTASITEDVEFAVQECLRGGRVAFEASAVCYDEQPAGLSVMMRQLLRWCTGSHQIFRMYMKKWLREFVKHPGIRLIDMMALLLMGPCSVLTFLCPLAANIIFSVSAHRIHPLQVIIFAGSYLSGVILPGIVAKYKGIPFKKIWRGVLTFPVFLWLYMLCSLGTFFRQETKWTSIEHRGIEK